MIKEKIRYTGVTNDWDCELSDVKAVTRITEDNIDELERLDLINKDELTSFISLEFKFVIVLWMTLPATVFWLVSVISYPNLLNFEDTKTLAPVSTFL